MGGTVVIGGDATGSVVEDGVLIDNGDLNQSGTNIATQIWDITDNPLYGNVSISDGGFWTYTLDNTNAMVDALDDGQILTDTFTVSLTIEGTTDTQIVTITINGSTDPCYTIGTKILTSRGWVRIEHLRKGVQILTEDNGYVPIQWIGEVKRELDNKHNPIVFPKNCFGKGVPNETLTVSPQHQILLGNFGNSMPKRYRDVFVPAHFLTDVSFKPAFHNDKLPFVYKGKAKHVHYFHILLEDHHVIYAQGVASESLNLGPIAYDAFIKGRAKSDIIEIEELARPHRHLNARPVLKKSELGPIMNYIMTAELT